jgi:photosystem II stability/assembly factor-like uncharacterized protein
MAGRWSFGVLVGVIGGGQASSSRWEIQTRGMRAEYMPPELAFEQNVQDPHAIVACTAQPQSLWCPHHNGIFRSTDGSASRQEIETAPRSSFGFAVAAHPTDPDTAWLVPAVKDEKRVRVDAALAVDDSGTALLMGSTTGNLWSSDDGGDHWLSVSTHLPPV